ncbi:MAG: Cell division coordinator CpoB [Gammaproteobacteria bacterium]|nr:Cell division coordinator CpoB [Gammaproteobacteria bacterium]
MFFRIKRQAHSALAVLAVAIIAGCGSTPKAPIQTSSDPVRKTVGVQELWREVAVLRDAIEVQRNEIKKLRERQRQLYGDLDHRLRQSEEQTSYGQGQQESSDQAQNDAQGQQPAYGQQAQGASQAAQQAYGQQGDTQGQQQTSQQSQSSGQGQQQAAYDRQSPGTTQQGSNQQISVASVGEQAAYDNAFELLKQSRYNDAIIDFRSMITRFPNGALVDDAQYWIGEAYYVTRDFESAGGAFDTVVNQYPDSQRVPEALLKLGYVQYELGQMPQARQTLNQVISQYPGSRVAISAETRLSKIR